METQTNSAFTKTPSWLDRFNRSRGVTIAIFVVVAIGFGLMNFLTPEWHQDDFSFSFIHGYRDVFGERIRSVSDFLTAFQEHRSYVNGRLSDCFFTKILLVGPNWIFDILNTLVLLLAIFLTTKLALGENAKKIQNTILLGVVALWFWCMPGFSEVMLWVAGAANYLWSWAAIAGFLLLWEKYAEGKLAFPRSAFLLVFSVFAGAMQESFSLPILCGFGIYYIFNLKKIRGNAILMVTGFFLGFLTIALAEGQLGRFGKTPLTPALGAFRLFFTFVRSPEVMAIIAIGLISLGVLFFKNREKFKTIFRNEIFWITSMLAGYCGLGLIISGGRGFAGVWLFSTVFLLRLVGKNPKKFLLPLFGTGFVAMICAIIYFAPMQYKLLLEHKQIEAEAKTTKSGFVPIEDFAVVRDEHRFVLFSSANLFSDLLADGYEKKTNLFARYFGRNDVNIFPVNESIYSALENETFCTPQNEFSPGAYTMKDAYFLLLPAYSEAFPSIEKISDSWKLRFCVDESKLTSLHRKIRCFFAKKGGLISPNGEVSLAAQANFVNVREKRYLMVFIPIEIKSVPLRIVALERGE